MSDCDQSDSEQYIDTEIAYDMDAIDSIFNRIRILEEVVKDEKITTTTRVNLLNERLVDEKLERDRAFREIHDVCDSKDRDMCKILDEDRETISNEIVGIHTRINANIDTCAECIKYIHKLETEISNIKENLIPSKSLCAAVTTLYVLTGICVIHAGGVVLPLFANLIKK